VRESSFAGGREWLEAPNIKIFLKNGFVGHSVFRGFVELLMKIHKNEKFPVLVLLQFFKEAGCFVSS
jgi:hypothetical protein